MAADQLQQILDGFRTRLQAELDAQVRALTEHQNEALDLVRHAAEAETEQRWSSRVEGLRAEWSLRLETDVAVARAEAERRYADESMRARLEAEQEAAETSARLRQELEEMRLTERRQADEALTAERQRLAEALSAQRLAEETQDAERQLAEQALVARRRAEEALDAERRRAEEGVSAQLRAEEALDEERRRAAGALAAQRQAEEALEAERRRAEGAVAGAQQLAQAEETVRAELRHAQEDLAAAQVRLTEATAEASRRTREPLESQSRQAEEALRAELRRVQEELDAARLRVDQAAAATQAAREECRRAEEALAHEQEALHAERVRAERSVANAREELDTERLRAEQAIAKAQTALDGERQRAEQAVAQARAASGPAPVLDGATLLADMRAIDAAASLSQALSATVAGASRTAPRVALFIVNGEHLEEWSAPGLPAMSSGSLHQSDRAAGLLTEVLRRHDTVSTGGNGAGPKAPAFAALPPGRTATAVPFVLGGQTVAVLYADEGSDGEAPPSWRDAIQILGRHASACLAHLTAVRTGQAMRLMSEGVFPAAEAGLDADGDDADGARRYARLLLSEIRLYNESVVRLGRQHGDLLQRLKPEIERARRLYEERVSMRQRDVYFQQELVHTLADGDAELLGQPSESSS